MVLGLLMTDAIVGYWALTSGLGLAYSEKVLRITNEVVSYTPPEYGLLFIFLTSLGLAALMTNGTDSSSSITFVNPVYKDDVDLFALWITNGISLRTMFKGSCFSSSSSTKSSLRLVGLTIFPLL